MTGKTQQVSLSEVHSSLCRRTKMRARSLSHRISSPKKTITLKWKLGSMLTLTTTMTATITMTEQKSWPKEASLTLKILTCDKAEIAPSSLPMLTGSLQWTWPSWQHPHRAAQVLCRGQSLSVGITFITPHQATLRQTLKLSMRATRKIGETRDRLETPFTRCGSHRKATRRWICLEGNRLNTCFRLSKGNSEMSSSSKNVRSSRSGLSGMISKASLRL